MNRRSFLIATLAACAAPAVPLTPKPAPAPPAELKVLVLGGTGFIGPHIVHALVAAGHTVTLFNRGKTHADMFPELEKLRGDRDGHLEALQGRSWDVVIDDAGFVPRIVKQSTDLLAKAVGHYIFISTISVYKDFAFPNMDETGPLDTLADPTTEDVPKNYGALKGACERVVTQAFAGRATILRPGVIVGPGDPTGRFTHWVSRLADGGEVLAPGDGTTPVQWIDVRDLAAWIPRVINDKTIGTYNAIGPAERFTMKQLVDACNAVGGNHAQPVWVAADFLEKQGVHGWSDMPLWLDPKAEMAAFGTLSNQRAKAKGLTFRTAIETAHDTLAWLGTLPADDRAKVASSGIPRDREAKVLAAWKARG